MYIYLFIYTFIHIYEVVSSSTRSSVCQCSFLSSFTLRYSFAECLVGLSCSRKWLPHVCWFMCVVLCLWLVVGSGATIFAGRAYARNRLHVIGPEFTVLHEVLRHDTHLKKCLPSMCTYASHPATGIMLSYRVICDLVMRLVSFCSVSFVFACSWLVVGSGATTLV